jgi:hypothetical protein
MPLGAFKLNSISKYQIVGPTGVTLDAVEILQNKSAYWQQFSNITKSITNNKTITFSAWVNVNDFSNRKTIFNLRTNRAPILFVVNTTGTVRFFSSGSETDTTVIDAATTSAVITSANTWYHIAGSFDMADTNKRAIYINGSPVSVTYTTYNNTNFNFNVLYRVGIGNNAEQNRADESGFRFSQIWIDNSYVNLSTNISKFYSSGPVDMGATGTTSGLSQPLFYHYGTTSSATPITTNRGRSSGVYSTYNLFPVLFDDNSSGRTQKTIFPINSSNAQTSTTQSKIGSRSLYLDGTGDFVTIGTTTDFNFGTGNFTIEGWFYLIATGTRIIFDKRTNSGGSGSGGPMIYVTATAVVYGSATTGSGWTQIVSAAKTFSTNTWYHIAIVRSSQVIKIFVDGTQIGTNANDTTNSGSTTSATIGANSDQTGTFPWNGYIDEYRISSTARYTANFTPSTTAFTDDANTLFLMHCDDAATNTTT